MELHVTNVKFAVIFDICLWKTQVNIKYFVILWILNFDYAVTYKTHSRKKMRKKKNMFTHPLEGYGLKTASLLIL